MPQVTGGAVPFHSEIRDHLKGRTAALEDLAVEMPARGLSVRDIEDAFKDESGRLLLSRTAVSESGARRWEDYREFATRDQFDAELLERSTHLGRVVLIDLAAGFRRMPLVRRSIGVK